MKYYPLFILLLLTGWGCKKELTSTAGFSSAYFTSFKLRSINNPKLTIDIDAEVDDTTVSCTLPIGISPDSLVASFETDDVVNAVTVNAIPQVSGTTMNSFLHTVVYTLHGRDNTARNYRVSVRPFTGLPIIYITTDGGADITSKDDYVTGSFTVNSNFSSYSNLASTSMQIRLRGNYSYTLPKKSYKVKFASKTSLLGMPDDKEWALQANYDDKSFMRNYLAFKLSQAFDMPYTPRTVFAEVYLNGAYQGNYLASEIVKIASNRVNIKSMAATDVSGSKLTGGYLLEVDARLDGTDTFVTDRDIDFVIHDPEFEQPAQINYIKTYVQQLEDALYGNSFTNPTTGYAKYLNTTTAIEWFWTNELSRNLDAVMSSSVFMYKDRDSTLHIGPAWDFDVAFGNYKIENKTSIPEGWYVRNAPWFSRLFQDPAFTQKAIDKWNTIRPRLDSLSSLIDATAFYLKYSAKADAAAWGQSSMYVYPNNGVAGTYEGEINYLKKWLATRIKWIDANLNTLQN